MLEQEFFHLRPASQHCPLAGIAQLSDLLKTHLSALGYAAEPIQEDWGMWIAIAKHDARMAIGVYGVGEDTPEREFAITVLTDKARRWIVWPFFARSIEPEITALQHDLLRVLGDTTDLVILSRTAEYPL